MASIVFERQGDGFPLVLVHGYFGGSGIWQNQVDHFKKQFDVVVPNLPGFGLSAALIAPNTIVGFAEKVLKDLLSLGIEKFHLVGHSMGGMIVQTMAALAPTRVVRLVCYGTGPMGVLPNRFETIETSRQRLHDEGLETVVKRIAATWFMQNEEAGDYQQCVDLGLQTSMQGALASLDAWETWDGRDQLKQISAKSLVIWGDGDRSYGWSQPEALWNGIPNCSLAVVPGCAHNVHMEKPELYNAILEDFLPAYP